jgi:V/A-type H+-transporting ATPase subunit I
MALAKTVKIAIFGLQYERKRMLETLQNTGMMEITNLNPDRDEEAAGINRVTAELGGNMAEVDQNLAAVARGLAFLDRMIPVRPSLVEQFAGVKTYLTPEEFDRHLQDEERRERALSACDRMEQELNAIQNRRVQLQTTLSNLLPWSSLQLPYAALQGSDFIGVFLGSTNHPTVELEAALNEAGVGFYLEPVNEEDKNILFVLLTRKDDRENIQTVLSRFNVNQVILPAFETTVADRIKLVREELAQLSKEEAGIKEQVGSLEGERPVLQVFYDALLNERSRLEIAGQLVHGEESFMLSGWVASDRLSQLEEALSKAKLKFALVPAEIETDEQPPTIMRNSKVVTPFEYLVQSFSYPQITEIDPTPSIAPFFFIFFGIALGDAGYGLILALICGIFLLKLKLGPVGKKISWMFLVSGIGAILFGLMTGSVLSLNNIKFGLFNPLQNPILLLIIALGLGLIQLYYGIFISAYLGVKDGRAGEVIANQGTLLFFLTSVLLVLGKDVIGLKAYATQLNYLLLTAAILMVIGNTYGKKGFVAKLLAIPGGLYSIYNTIGFFSDVLSYSRLMALGLSSGVMGGIMNQLGVQVFNSMPVIGWIFGAAILIFGHALNFALSVLGAYVHSSRLQYLEFFGKFYEGGGRPFTPFHNKPKYTFLINKREA